MSSLTRGADREQYSYSFDYTGSDLTYLGMAVAGQSQADPVWQIRKIAYDGSSNITSIRFANGSKLFNSVWNDRASLTYT